MRFSTTDGKDGGDGVEKAPGGKEEEGGRRSGKEDSGGANKKQPPEVSSLIVHPLSQKRGRSVDISDTQEVKYESKVRRFFLMEINFFKKSTRSSTPFLFVHYKWYNFT